ncbi:MAG: CpaD family pilus assembly protein [Novosphingobium sp.]
MIPITRSRCRRLAQGVPVAAALLLAGCGGMSDNRSLESVHQPVIERTAWTLDLAGGPGGLGFDEPRRLAEWFASLPLSPGDRVAIDDPAGDPGTRATIAALAARHGARVGPGPVAASEPWAAPGSVRVVVSRTVAGVPGCPDWSDKSDAHLTNGTHSNFGCAVNANLAAMVADPEHLLHGAGDTGATTMLTASKAIESYRKAPPSGEKGLQEVSTTEGSGAQ